MLVNKLSPVSWGGGCIWKQSLDPISGIHVTKEMLKLNSGNIKILGKSDLANPLLISKIQNALCNETNRTNGTNNLVQFCQCNWIFDDDFLYSVKQWPPFPMSITSTSLSEKRLQQNCSPGYKSLPVPSFQMPRDTFPWTFRSLYLWVAYLSSYS